MAPRGKLEGQLLGGRFFVQRTLGSGSFGTVYLAEQRIFERRLRSVALKLFNEQMVTADNAGDVLNDAIVLMRMQEDAAYPEVAAHLVTMLDAGFVGEAPGQAFMAMEYVEGYRPPDGGHIRTLDGLIRAFHPVPVDLALRWMRQILRPVAWMHSRKPRILHCDLKPENILAHGQDMLKVADFGLAQLATGVIGSKAAGGTLVYQPPETLSGAEPTPASDVYALGLILYEMLAGENPFDAVQLQAVAEGGRSQEISRHLRARQERVPSLLDVDHPELAEHRVLVDIVDRCLRYQGSDRYEDAGALLLDLDNHQASPAQGAGANGHGLARTHREVHLLIADGRLDQAWARCEAAAERYPDSARPFAWMAEVRLADGLAEQALELCAKGTEIDRGEPEIWEATARAYDAQGLAEIAASVRRRAASHGHGNRA